jgi:hypothetical protein
MSLESSEVVVGLTGHIYRAPVGTAFPTNISTAVNDALWTELGYVTEDGVTFNFGREVQEIMAWQSFDPLRVIPTAIPKTIAWVPRQLNQNTFATAMGGGTWSEGTPGNYEYEPPDESDVDEFALIVEFADGDQNYRFCYRKVMNQEGVEFVVNRQDSINLSTSVKVLAADAGAKPFIFQTDDANLGEFAEAGS